MKQAQSKIAKVEHTTVRLETLTKHYMEISQCWADPTKAVELHMSVERALSTLRTIRDIAAMRINGKKLAAKANKLLIDIVDNQMDRNKL